MLDSGDRVLVGVSGGPDSMALLHLLVKPPFADKIELGVAHLNHCLRGETAEKEADFVSREAAALGVPCHVGRARVVNVKRKLGLSLEEAGHRVRYAFFNKVMAERGYNKLALGHHMDDNAEQLLLALLRGTGPRGLAGIAPTKENRIIRPLIHARRAQIEAYIEAENISGMRDASNDDARFLRNRIRHDLLPLLTSAYNPRIGEHLNRLADVMRTEESWIGDLVAQEYPKTTIGRKKDEVVLSVDRLRTIHTALMRRLIRAAIEEVAGNLRRIEFSHIHAISRLLTGSDGKECHLPGGLRARRIGDRLTLSVVPHHRRRSAAAKTEKATWIKKVLDGPLPENFEIREMGIGLRFSFCSRGHLPPWTAIEPNRAYLDFDRLALPLTVRRPAPGDRFCPLGAGGRQKLKKFFIDHRIARRDRSISAILADRRGIVWLIGQRIDERVKVTSRTSQILNIEFFLLDTR
ncbi:tRNA(Ile)-lysidine synthase [Desulfosarcina widdelii]|uniref:tRNA(Ile)-lysidine synthase n=2 Tax=Desulfosarcina widdelii TaxID=947919 RepID=A0A5K7Z2Y6_9BACT|nr:tRNA(Ile)-lysidine synthase [Desulfosarcina widdelii]